MKNILFALLLTLPILACGEKKTRVCFQVTDYTGHRPTVTIGFKNYRVEMDSVTGKGCLTLDLSAPTYAVAEVRRHEKRTLFLEPGKDLNLSYSMAKGEKGVTFGGDLAVENQFLSNTNLLSGFIVNGKERDIRKIAQRQDSILLVSQNKLEEIALPAEFKAWEKKRLEVQSFASLLRPFVVDTTLYLQTLRERVVEDPSFLSIPEYREFLKIYVRTLVRLTAKNNRILEGPVQTDREVVVILNNFKDPEIISYLIDLNVFRYGEQGMKKYVDLYNQHVTDPERLKLFAEMCRKADRVSPGNPCPDFCFKDNTGKEVALSDLRGKYLYIDIWATWCGPCKGEMPALHELEKQFAGKDITFVSLSVDRNKDIELWKQTIQEMKLGGVQLHLGENWDWLKIFMPGSMAVPRMILLDKEGIIIDAHMSRPSDQETAKNLEKLLGETKK